MYQSSSTVQSYIWQDIPSVFFSFAPIEQWYKQNNTTAKKKKKKEMVFEKAYNCPD